VFSAANDRYAMDMCDLVRAKSFHEEHFAIMANCFVKGQVDHWGKPVQMQPQIISKINPELALEVLELLQKNVRYGRDCVQHGNQQHLDERLK
jgi:hypothetical protein